MDPCPIFLFVINPLLYINMDCPVLFRTKMVILQVSLGKKKSIPYLLCSSKWLRGWWGGTSYHQPVSPTAASWISMMKGIAFLRTSIIMTFCDLFALSHSWPSAIFFLVLAWRFWMQENSQALFLSPCPKGIFVAKSSFIYFFSFPWIVFVILHCNRFL